MRPRSSLTHTGLLLALGLPALANEGVDSPASQPVVPETQEQMEEEAAPDYDFREALLKGRFWVLLNYRVAAISDDIPAATKTGYPSTLRTVLGYETGEWKGMKGTLEFENVSGIGNMLFSTSPSQVVATGYPFEPDPTGTSINRVTWDYVGVRDTKLSIGRQYLKYDNVRWIGEVAWRQKFQTFDAASFNTKILKNADISLAYADRVNRVTRAIMETSTGAVNLAYTFEDLGRLTFYNYYLDFDESAPALSSNTLGLRFAGKHDLSDDFGLLYQAEFANQTDIGDNPADLNESYYLADLGVRVSKVDIRVAVETLGGDGTAALQAPLSTLHAHNGWADRFLVTPVEGLMDYYLLVGGPVGKKWKWSARLHDFNSDAGSLHYGSELDLLATYQVVENGQIGLKAAFYSGDDASSSDPLTSFDATKVWLWMRYTW